MGIKLKKLRSIINIVVIYLRLTIVCTLFCPLLFICLLFVGSHHTITSLIIKYGAQAILWAIRIPVHIEGSYSSNPSIIVANHQSIIDIPLVAAALPAVAHQWLYKYELNNIFILGTFFSKIGIAVPRLSFSDGLGVLRSISKRAKEYPYNLIIFPEGARFVDGAIHEFMPGFGILAQKLSYSVVPLYIHNAGRVCPPGSFCIHYTPVKIIIGPSFNIADGESIKSFIQRVRSWFLEQEQMCAVE